MKNQLYSLLPSSVYFMLSIFKSFQCRFAELKLTPVTFVRRFIYSMTRYPTVDPTEESAFLKIDLVGILNPS